MTRNKAHTLGICVIDIDALDKKQISLHAGVIIDQSVRLHVGTISWFSRILYGIQAAFLVSSMPYTPPYHLISTYTNYFVERLISWELGGTIVGMNSTERCAYVESISDDHIREV